MISAAIILPTIAPIAVPPSLDEPGPDVGPAEVELEVTEDPVGEPVGNNPVEGVSGNEEVSDGEIDVMVDVGSKVEEGGVTGVEPGVGETFVELGGVGDAGGKSVVLGGVGPP